MIADDTVNRLMECARHRPLNRAIRLNPSQIHYLISVFTRYKTLWKILTIIVGQTQFGSHLLI
jgi:hypothetical protein